MRLTSRYLTDRQKTEGFKDFVQRIGKAEIKKMVEDLLPVPSHDVDPSYFTDWSDAREYTIGDIGIGECAGAVVSAVEFELTAAEREVFEAQLLLEKGDFQNAGALGYQAMLKAARGLVKHEFLDVSADPDTVVNEFKTRYYDTQLFHDPFAGGKFAQYLFLAHKKAGQGYNPESAHQTIEEASLFIEAAYRCYSKLVEQQAAAKKQAMAGEVPGTTSAGEG
jgi:sulfite reductase (ferredoxin)